MGYAPRPLPGTTERTRTALDVPRSPPKPNNTNGKRFDIFMCLHLKLIIHASQINAMHSRCSWRSRCKSKRVRGFYYHHRSGLGGLVGSELTCMYIFKSHLTSMSRRMIQPTSERANAFRLTLRYKSVCVPKRGWPWLLIPCFT